MELKEKEIQFALFLIILLLSSTFAVVLGGCKANMNIITYSPEPADDRQIVACGAPTEELLNIAQNEIQNTEGFKSINLLDEPDIGYKVHIRNFTGTIRFERLEGLDLNDQLSEGYVLNVDLSGETRFSNPLTFGDNMKSAFEESSPILEATINIQKKIDQLRPKVMFKEVKSINGKPVKAEEEGTGYNDLYFLIEFANFLKELSRN